MAKRNFMKLMILGIVLAALAAALLAIITPNVISRDDDEKITRARAEIARITIAVHEYELQQNMLPESLEFVARQGFVDSVPTDPWGNPYYFSAEEPDFANASARFYVWTLGEDGEVGGRGPDEDYGNWNGFGSMPQQ